MENCVSGKTNAGYRSKTIIIKSKQLQKMERLENEIYNVQFFVFAHLYMIKMKIDGGIYDISRKILCRL
mgnify:CR=1 FL=1